ncbi:MAG: glycoside hydrolase family 25 protein [Actinomycetia bacterium]|nr:glycoside hydrolase family 25 protein [Actinomycetes bacterium]
MRARVAGGALAFLAALAVFLGPAAPAAASTSASAAGLAGNGTTTAAPSATSNAVPGIDISGSTKVSDWSQVATGNSFVGVEAVQGKTITNTNYASQVTAASVAGLYVMPYVFADPAKISGAEEFGRAWSVINGVIGLPYATGSTDLPIALDMEWDQINFPAQECYGLTTSQIVSWIQDFISAAEQQVPGMIPVIYTGQDWWDDCTGGSAAFAANRLWLASYNAVPAMPAGWPAYTSWQSSDMATVSGITGQADVDQMQSAPTLATVERGASFALQVQSLNLLAGQAVTSYTATGLPSGLQVSPSGLISGQLTSTDAPGSYQVQVTSPDATVVPSSVAFTLDVYAPLMLTAPPSTTTTVGAPVSLQVGSNDQNVGAPGYTPPVFQASGLPAGTSVSPTGLISGWPAAPGSYQVTVSARDGLYANASASFTWTVQSVGDSGPTGTIRQHGGSGKCLDDPSGKTTSGTAIGLVTCTGKPNQAWTAVQDGTIRVLGHCLAASGNHVLLYPCNGSVADQWLAGTDGALVSARYGTCLNGPSGAVPNGTKPTLAACTPSPTKVNQHWARPVQPVVSGVTGTCLGASGSAAGSAVELDSCGNYSAQHWRLASNGQFAVQSKSCLTEAGPAAGSAITVTNCVNAAAQHWKLVTADVVADEIESTASGLCVTVPSGATANGTELVLGPCSTTLASTWRVG